MSTPGGNRVDIGTNIPAVAKEIVEGLTQIDGALGRVGTARPPTTAVVAQMQADFARLRTAAEGDLAAIERRIERTALSINKAGGKVPAGTETLTGASKPVVADLAKGMQQVTAAYVKAYGDSTGELRTAGSVAGQETLRQVNGLYTHINQGVTELAASLRLPASRLIGRTDLGKSFQAAEQSILQLESRLAGLARATATAARTAPTASSQPPPAAAPPAPPRVTPPPAAAGGGGGSKPPTAVAAAGAADDNSLPSQAALKEKLRKRGEEVDRAAAEDAVAAEQVVQAARGLSDGLRWASNGARRLNITLEQAAALVDRQLATRVGDIFKIPGSGVQNVGGTGVVGEYHQIRTEPATEANPNPKPYLAPLTRTYQMEDGSKQVHDDRLAVQKYDERLLTQRGAQDTAALRESKAQDMRDADLRSTMRLKRQAQTEDELRTQKKRAEAQDKELVRQLNTPAASGTVDPNTGKPLMMATQVGKGNSNLFSMQSEDGLSRVLVTRTKLGVEQIAGETRLHQSIQRMREQSDEGTRKMAGFFSGIGQGFFSRGFNGSGGGASAANTPITSFIRNTDSYRDTALTNFGATAGTLLKYTALSAVIGGVTGAIASEGAQVRDFTDSLTDLQVAFGKNNDVSQSFIGNLGEIARLSGSNVAEAMDSAARGVRAFGDEGVSANNVGQDFAKTAAQLALITGGKLTDKTGDLIASASAFNVAPENQSQILDAVAYAKRFGGDPNQISQGLANFASVGAASGFTPLQSAGFISTVSGKNDETGQAAATRLSRMLATLQGANAKSTLAGMGISTAGTPAQVLENAIRAYQNLGKAQQQQLLIAVGGTAQQRETTAVFQQGLKVLDDTADASKAVGAGEDEARRRAGDLVGLLKALSADLKGIQTGLFQSDVFAPIVAGLKLLEPSLHILDRTIELFNELTRLGDKQLHLPVSLMAGLAIDAAVAVAIYRKIKAAREAAAARNQADSAVQTFSVGPQPGATVLPIVPRSAATAAPAAAADAGAASTAAANTRTAQSATAAATAEDSLAASTATAAEGATAAASAEDLLAAAQQRVAATSHEVDVAMAQSQAAYDRIIALQETGVATAEQLAAARASEAAADEAVVQSIRALTGAEVALEAAQEAVTASTVGEAGALDLLQVANDQAVISEKAFQVSTDASTVSIGAKTAALEALAAAQAAVAGTAAAAAVAAPVAAAEAAAVPVVAAAAAGPVSLAHPNRPAPTEVPPPVIAPASTRLRAYQSIDLSQAVRDQEAARRASRIVPPVVPAPFSSPAAVVPPVPPVAPPPIVTPFSEPTAPAPVVPTAPIVPPTAVPFTGATQAIPVRAPITESVVPGFRQPSTLPQQLRVLNPTGAPRPLPSVEPAMFPVGAGGPSSPLFPGARNVRSAGEVGYFSELERQRLAQQAAALQGLSGPTALPFQTGRSILVSGGYQSPATRAGIARLTAAQVQRARLAQGLAVNPNLLTNTFVGPSTPLSARPIPVTAPASSPFLVRTGAGQVLPISDAERAATGNLLAGPTALPFQTTRAISVASGYQSPVTRAGIARLTAAQAERARLAQALTVNPNLLTRTYVGPSTPLSARPIPPIPITAPAASPFLTRAGAGQVLPISDAERAATGNVLTGPAALPFQSATRSIQVASAFPPGTAAAGARRLTEVQVLRARQLAAQGLTVNPNLLTNTYVGPSTPLSARPIPITAPGPSPYLVSGTGPGQNILRSETTAPATLAGTGPSALPTAAARSIVVGRGPDPVVLRRQALAAELEAQRLATNAAAAPPFSSPALRVGDVRSQILRARGINPYGTPGINPFGYPMSGPTSAFPRVERSYGGYQGLYGARTPAISPTTTAIPSLTGKAIVLDEATLRRMAPQLSQAMPAAAMMRGPIAPNPNATAAEAAGATRVVGSTPGTGFVLPGRQGAQLNPAEPGLYPAARQITVPRSAFRVIPNAAGAAGAAEEQVAQRGLFSRLGAQVGMLAAPLAGGGMRTGTFRPNIATETNPFGKISSEATEAQRANIGKLRAEYLNEINTRKLGSLTMRELYVKETGNFAGVFSGVRGAANGIIGGLKGAANGIKSFAQSGFGLLAIAVGGALLVDKTARTASSILTESGRTSEKVQYDTRASSDPNANRQAAADLRTSAKRSTDASGGLIGSAVNFLYGDPTGRAANAATSQADSLDALAKRIDAIRKDAAIDPTKDPSGAIDVGVPNGIATGLQVLADSGRNAEVQFDALIKAFGRLGEGAVDAAGRLTGNNEQVFEANLGFNVGNTIAGGISELQGKRNTGKSIENAITPGFIPDWLKGKDVLQDEANTADQKKLAGVDTNKLNDEINKRVAASGENVATPEGKAAIEKMVRTLVSNAVPELQDKDLRNQIIQNAVDQVGTTAEPLMSPPVLADALKQLQDTAPAANAAKAQRRAMLVQAGLGSPLEMSQGADLTQAETELSGAEATRQAAIDAINAQNEQQNKGRPERVKDVDPNDPRLEKFNDDVTAAEGKRNAAKLQSLDRQAALVDAQKGPADEKGAIDRKMALIDAKIAANKDPDVDLTLQADKANAQREKIQQAQNAAASNRLAAVDPRDKVGQADAAKTNADAALQNVTDQLKAAGVKPEDYALNDDYNQAVIADNNAKVNAMVARRDEAAGLAKALVDPRDKVASLQADINALDVVIAQAIDGSAEKAQAQADRAAKVREQWGVATDRANARQSLGVRSGDTLGEDRAAVDAATRSLNDGTILQFDSQGNVTAEWLKQQKAISDAQAKLANDQRAAANAQAASLVQPGDNVAAARQALDQAVDELNGLTAGNADYFNKQKEIADKQRALADAQLVSAQLLRIAGIDRTNNVTVAMDDLTKAQEKQAEDIRNRMGKDTLNQDAIDVADANQKADAAGFSQRLSDAQVADQLGRSSHATYLQYLKGEHDRLTERLAGMKATDEGYRQAIDQLNQIDQLQKEAAASLEGQFNLGDIKLPSVYEVRRSLSQDAIAANGGSQTTQIVNNTISINGADTAEVKRVITGLLGPTAISRTPTSAGAKL